jgi:hypothetical protein
MQCGTADMAHGSSDRSTSGTRTYTDMTDCIAKGALGFGRKRRSGWILLEQVQGTLTIVLHNPTSPRMLCYRICCAKEKCDSKSQQENALLKRSALPAKRAHLPSPGYHCICIKKEEYSLPVFSKTHRHLPRMGERLAVAFPFAASPQVRTLGRCRPVAPCFWFPSSVP